MAAPGRHQNIVFRKNYLKKGGNWIFIHLLLDLDDLIHQQ